MKLNTIITRSMLGLALIISSCVSQKNVTLFQGKNSIEGESYKNSNINSYKLNNGDHLYIKVYSLDPKTSKLFNSDYPDLMNKTYLYLNSYMVDEYGYISFSFIDKLYVNGLTADEVKEKLQSKLDEYFKETNVVVKVINFDVSILGEVNNPGTFNITKDQINVFHALGLAGGVTDFGNIRNIKVIRHTAKGTEIHYLDLSNKAVLSSPYYYLCPNDIIYIEPRGTKSFVLEKAPYQTVLSVLSIALGIYAILQ